MCIYIDVYIRIGLWTCIAIGLCICIHIAVYIRIDLCTYINIGLCICKYIFEFFLHNRNAAYSSVAFRVNKAICRWHLIGFSLLRAWCHLASLLLLCRCFPLFVPGASCSVLLASCFVRSSVMTFFVVCVGVCL